MKGVKFDVVNPLIIAVQIWQSSIFLDESGQFNKKCREKYFVIGSFTVGNQKRTDKEFRKWVKTKFPKRMKNQSEVKWSQRGIDENLRLKTIKYIANLDVRIRYGFLSCHNISTRYVNNKNGKINSGELYIKIIGEIIEGYLPTNEKEIYVFCDSRHLKGMTKKDF